MMAYISRRNKFKILVVAILILTLISTYVVPASVFAEDVDTESVQKVEETLPTPETIDNSQPGDGTISQNDQPENGSNLQDENPDAVTGEDEGQTEMSEGNDQVEPPGEGSGAEYSPNPDEEDTSSQIVTPDGVEVGDTTEEALDLVSDGAITSEGAIIPEETVLTVNYHFKPLEKEVQTEDAFGIRVVERREWTQSKTYEHLVVGEEVTADQYGIADKKYELVGSDPESLKLEPDGNIINLYYQEVEEIPYVPKGIGGNIALYAGLPKSAIGLRMVSLLAGTDTALNAGEVAASKSANWADYDNRIAEVTFNVKGEPRREPVNIVLVFDRSVSMTWDLYSPTTDASPCTNPAHINPYGYGSDDATAHRNAERVVITKSYNNGCTNRLSHAKDAADSFAKQFLQNNEIGNQIALVPFSGSVTSSLALNFTTNYKDFSDSVKGIFAFGSTNYTEALAEAQTYINDLSPDLKTRKTYVVMMSDGKPNLGDGLAVAAELKDQNVTIYSVGIQMMGDSDTALRNVASSGCYYDVNNPPDLVAILNSIAGEVKDAGTDATIEDYIDTRYYEYYQGDKFIQPSSITWGGVSNPEKVTWNIGKITADTKTVTFYVKLKDRYANLAGSYPTNTDAILSYTDINNNPAQKTMPNPQLGVESGSIKVNYRLVDKSTGLYITDQGSLTDDLAFSQITRSEDFAYNGTTVLPIASGGSSYTVTASKGSVISGNTVIFNGKTYVIYEDNSVPITLTKTNPNSTVNFKCYEQEGFAVIFSSESAGELTGAGITVNGEGKVIYTSVANGTAFSSLTVPTPLPKQHYEFDYWKDNSTGQRITSFPETVTGNLGYTAVYKAKTYSVSYDSQGGSSVSAAPNNVPVGNYTVTTTEPIREGYTFDKWTVNSDGTGAAYQPGDAIYVDRDTTLYAQWTLNSHKVIYKPGVHGTLSVNENGGTISDGEVIHSNVNYGSQIPGEPKVSPSNGWTFTGFTPKKPSDNRMPDNDLIYTAQYSQIEYTIIFYNGDHGDLGGQDAKGTVIFNKLHYDGSFPAEPDVTADTGYVFTGWKLNNEGSLLTSLPSKVTDNASYTAQYAKKNNLSYTVKYYKDSVNDSNLLGDADVTGITYEELVTLAAGNQSGQLNYKKPAGYKDGVQQGTVPYIIQDGSNTINVVYEKDHFNYIVKYYVDEVGLAPYNPSAGIGNYLGEVTGSGVFGSAIPANLSPTNSDITAPEGYFMPGAKSGATIVSEISSQNIVHVVYSKRADLSYTINYFKDTVGSTENNSNYLGSATVDGVTYGTVIILDDSQLNAKKPLPGYSDGVQQVGEPGSWTIKLEGNVINVLYEKKNDLSYTVEYYKDSVSGSPITTAAITNVTFGSVITLESNTDFAQLNYAKPAGYMDGVQQDGSYTIIDGTNTIKVLYNKASYVLTVNYVYEDGSTAAATTTTFVKYDAPYSIESPVIAGHTADKSVVSGTMPAEDVTETVTYTANRNVITVNHVYEGEPAVTTTSQGIYGKNISASAINKEGFTFDGSPQVAGMRNTSADSTIVSGVMPDDNVTITFNYIRNNYTVTVIYNEVESDGTFVKEISSDSVIKAYGADYDATAVNPNEVVYTLKDTHGAQTGTVTGNVTVTHNYTRNNYTVTVIYNEVKEDGTVVKEISSSSAIQPYGADYDATAVNPNEAEYTFKDTDGNSKGTVTGNVTVTHNYTRNNYSVTVIYNEVKEDGTVVKEISSSSAIKAYGADYDATAVNPNAAEYTFKDTDGNSKGTVTENVTVTHNYTRNNYSVTVIYNEVMSDGTFVKEISSDSTIKAYGTDYDATAVNPNAAEYTFKDTDGNSMGTVTGNVTVTHNYTRNTYTVTVKYIEVAGDTEIEITPSAARVDTMDYGDAYSVTEDNPNPAAFTLVPDSYQPGEAVAGTVKGDVTITFKYLRKQITITFLPGTNGTLGEPVTGGTTSGSAVVYNLKYGDSFPTPPAVTAASRYRFTKWDPNITEQILKGIVTADATYTANYEKTGGGGGGGGDSGGGGGGGSKDLNPPLIIRDEDIPEASIEIIDETIPKTPTLWGRLPKTGGVSPLLLYGIGVLLTGSGIAIRRREKKGQ